MKKKIDTSEVHISCDRNLLDERFVYQYLHENMYWAKSLIFEVFRKSILHSTLIFGVYDHVKGGERQIGFARVVSDCATFAYLTDVFIVDAYRGQGLSIRLMQSIIDHPELQGLRRFVLVTEDAGGLYTKFGFQPLADADHWMQILHDY
jgi:GNAT superfamily N-acetyltransferase